MPFLETIERLERYKRDTREILEKDERETREKPDIDWIETRQGAMANGLTQTNKLASQRDLGRARGTRESQKGDMELFKHIGEIKACSGTIII